MPRRPFDYAALASAFAEQGFHRATMDSVAERAGVAKPTIYRYFESKQELFEATVAAECERLIEHLFSAYEASEALPLGEGIRVATGACFEYARERPEGFQLLFMTSTDRAPGAAAQIERMHARVTERVAETFRRELEARGNPAGQVADVLAAATVGTSELVARNLFAHPEWDESAVLDLITELWTRALSSVSRHTLERVDRPRRSRRQARRSEPR
jgi:AcrR family transcriptional regulator